MSETVPVADFRRRLSELLDSVVDRRDHVVITRNGRPAAAVVPIDEYEALEETAEILADPETMAAIEEGLEDFERGRVHEWKDVRQELQARRPRS